MCYMNAAFHFLSYSYQDIKPPRKLNEDIIKAENYEKLKYPALKERKLTKRIKLEKINKIMKPIPYFQNYFHVFFK